jgi:Domain of unknown function (DUF3783)
LNFDALSLAINHMRMRLVAVCAMLLNVVYYADSFAPGSFQGCKLVVPRVYSSSSTTMGLGGFFKRGTGKFVQLGSPADAPAFGPRCILAGGLPQDEISTLKDLLSYQTHPLLLLTEDLSSMTLQQALEQCSSIAEAQQAQGPALCTAAMDAPLLIVSGYGTDELRGLIANYKAVTDLRPAFAKAVPNAMGKQLKQLCAEIADDHKTRLAEQQQRGV